MKVFKDVEQQTDDWFRLKWGKAGGSSAKDAMAFTKKLDDNKFFFRILGERCHSFDDVDHESFTNSAMEHGNQWEPEALKALISKTGIKFEKYGWIERNDFHGHSPDGMTDDYKDGVEIKCPQPTAFAEMLYKQELPDEYFFQVVNMFAVNPTLERVHFVAFDPFHMHKSMFHLIINKWDEYERSINRKKTVLPVAAWAEMLNSRIDEMSGIINDHIEKISF